MTATNWPPHQAPPAARERLPWTLYFVQSTSHRTWQTPWRALQRSHSCVGAREHCAHLQGARTAKSSVMTAVAEPEAPQASVLGPGAAQRPTSVAEQSLSLTPPQKQTLYENTYITHPRGYGEARVACMLRRRCGLLIADLLSALLTHQCYAGVRVQEAEGAGCDPAGSAGAHRRRTLQPREGRAGALYAVWRSLRQVLAAGHGHADSAVPAQQAKQLADDVRERVKALGFERHKLVVMVRPEQQHCLRS